MMQVTQEEIAALIGLKDIEIMVLQKRLSEAQKQIAALTLKTDAPELKAVPSG